MRFGLVALIWIVLFGGLFTYVQQRDKSLHYLDTTQVTKLEISDKQYSLSITPTFSLENDPFALTTDNSSSSALIRINGKEIEIPGTGFERGKKLTVPNLPEIHVGQNQLYIQASPPVGETMLEHAVRLEIVDDRQTIASTTIWSTQGAQVSGILSFTIDNEQDTKHEH